MSSKKKRKCDEPLLRQFKRCHISEDAKAIQKYTQNEEQKELRRTIALMQNEIMRLHRKIDTLDEKPKSDQPLNDWRFNYIG